MEFFPVRTKIPAVALVACLAAGFGLAQLLPSGGMRESAPAARGAPATDAADAPLAERVRRLERALGQEREARQLLEDELFYLAGEFERLRAGRPGSAAAEARAAASEPRTEMRRSQPPAAVVRETRAARLVEAGFTPERAEWILQRESRLQLTMLEARHAASREGDWDGYRELARAEQQAFRDELGPDYERYLDGTGRPTAITVTGVMDTSPAQRAGLRPGDRILSYGGRRIYSMSDLNDATLAGAAGESVLLQIERDGMPMQIAIPRGPVGITGAGGGRRSQ